MAISRGERPGLGSRVLTVVVGGTGVVTLLALAGQDAVAEMGILLGLVLGAVFTAVAVAVLTIRVVVPLFVRGCRAAAGGYRLLRPNSAIGRLVALTMGTFAVVGGLFLGVGSLAF